MKQKIVSICLALALACSLLPLSALAAEDEFVIENGVVTAYTGPGGHVVIPDGVTKIGYQAFMANKNITSVTLPDGLREIDGAAFLGCQSLSSINFPESMEKIGLQAFYDSGLTEVSIPSGVISLGDLSPNGFRYDSGELAFTGCPSLTRIDVATGNQYYSSLDGVLFNKDRSTLMVYPLAKSDSDYTIPRGVKKIWSYAFDACMPIRHVTVPDGLEVIDHGAFQLSGLTSITLPASTKTIGAAAFNCSIKEVYYAGSQSQWSQINIKDKGEQHDGLQRAYIFYGATGPDGVEMVKTPTVTPNGGKFVGSQTVTLACATPGAKIYYSSAYANHDLKLTLYTKPFVLTTDEKLVVYAIKDGMRDSEQIVVMFYEVSTPEEIPGRDPNEKPDEGSNTPDVPNTPTTPPGQSHMPKPSTTIPDWTVQTTENIPSSWAKGEVEQAISSALVPNDLQGNYRNPITREEFCRLIVTMVELKLGMSTDEYIATLDAWHKEYAAAVAFTDTGSAAVKDAYGLGIVKGTTATTFNPDGSITRQEAAAMLNRAAQLLRVERGVSQNFDEMLELYESGADWAANAIHGISDLVDPISGKAVMGGTGGNKFSPFATYSREQAILTVLRLFHCNRV